MDNRVSFKISKLFDYNNDGHLALLRLMAACNDINTANILMNSDEVYSLVDIKEVKQGLRLYFFRIAVSHFIEAKQAFSSLKITDFGKDLLKNAKQQPSWKDIEGRYAKLVDFFERENPIFSVVKDKIRHGIGFHYSQKHFKEAMLALPDKIKSLIVVGPTYKDTRYVVTDELMGRSILELREDHECILQDLSKMMGHLNAVTSSLLTSFMLDNNALWEEM